MVFKGVFRKWSAGESVLLCSVLLALSCLPYSMAQQPSSFIVHNGTIYTMDEASPQPEAMCVRHDRVAALGTLAEMKEICAGSMLMDVRGAMVLPGLIDR